MQLSKLYALVANGETEQIEFKKSTGQRTEGAKTVCAMLILFGSKAAAEGRDGR